MVESTTQPLRSEHDALLLLVQVAADLTQTLPSPQRFERLVTAAQAFFPCDAVALLRFEGDAFVPVAAQGLALDTLDREFVIDNHPRLRAIADAPGPILFAADDPRSDPFDGLVDGADDGRIHVHSCLGVPLRINDQLIGAITMDALEPGQFDTLDLDLLSAFGYLAAAAVQTSLLIGALERRSRHRDEVARHLVREALERHGGRLVGESDALIKLRREIELVAGTDLAVLITGETGTGKELVARSIHALSARAEDPLVHVNCAALTESLAESELFGHVRGAFTGAVNDRPGKFELAHGGTLFLDEVGELPPSIQATLLRALQFGEIQRVGEDKARFVSVRVIAATNRDLAAEVESGTFRRDLYHRLSVYPVDVPPLRDRGDDAVLLAGHFMETCRQRLSLEGLRLSGTAREALGLAAWPGNVRELEHVILRASLRAAQRAGTGPRVVATIEYTDLRLDPHPAASALGINPASELEPVLAEGVSLGDATDAYQRRLISAAVEATGGNWAGAARKLGIDRSNLHRLALRLGLKT